MNIKLKKISKYYYDQGKSTKGIENISLDVNTDGSFVVITGESGSGKSTLIKLITGLEEYDEGEIFIDGQAISNFSDKKRQQIYTDNISFVFQDYNLIESITCKENITLALLKQGKTKKEAKKLAVKALKEVNLNFQKNMRVSKLSGGERQRVAIARSLALNTPVIVFDEPTGNLDAATSKQVIDLIEKISKNKLILYVTHDYEIVKHCVTRHIVLADGNLVKDVRVNKPQNEGEAQPAEISKKSFSFSSYMYSTYLIGFKRWGRMIATLIVLILAYASVVGNFYVFGLTASTLGFTFGLPADTANTTYSAGNVIKNRVATDDEPELELVGETYYDYGNTLDQEFHINSDVYNKQYYGDSEDTRSLEDPFYIDKKILPYYTGKATLIEGDADVEDTTSFYIPDTWVDGYYMDTVETIMTGDITIGTEFAFSAEEGSALDELIAEMYTTKITKLYQYDTSENNSLEAYLVLDKPGLDAVHNYCKKESSYRSANDGPVNTTEDAIVTPLNINLGDIKADYYSPRNNFPDEYSSQLTTYDKLYLSKNLEGKDLTIDYKVLKLDITDFDPLYIFNEDNRFFIKSSQMISVLGEKHYLYTVYFDSVENAKTTFENNKATHSRIYYVEYASFPTVDYTLDIRNANQFTRLTNFATFCGMLINFFITGFIIKIIINRFYYRKNYDQQVLGYIGYSFKDIVIVNLLEFLTLGLVSTAIVLGIFIPFVPNAAAIFGSNVWLAVLAVVIDLLAAVFFALPSRKKVREND